MALDFVAAEIVGDVKAAGFKGWAAELLVRVYTHGHFRIDPDHETQQSVMTFKIREMAKILTAQRNAGRLQFDCRQCNRGGVSHAIKRLTTSPRRRRRHDARNKKPLPPVARVQSSHGDGVTLTVSWSRLKWRAQLASGHQFPRRDERPKTRDESGTERQNHGTKAGRTAEKAGRSDPPTYYLENNTKNTPPPPPKRSSAESNLDAEWAAAAEFLSTIRDADGRGLSFLDRAIRRAKDRGLTPAEVIAIGREFQRLCPWSLKSAGAIWVRIAEGAWPVEVTAAVDPGSRQRQLEEERRQFDAQRAEAKQLAAAIANGKIEPLAAAFKRRRTDDNSYTPNETTATDFS